MRVKFIPLRRKKQVQRVTGGKLGLPPPTFIVLWIHCMGYEFFGCVHRTWLNLYSTYIGLSTYSASHAHWKKREISPRRVCRKRVPFRQRDDPVGVQG